MKTDTDLVKIDKSFGEYYALRASVAFSFGSHDEWNVVREIDAPRQQGLRPRAPTRHVFDGSPVAGLYATPVATGTAGACERGEGQGNSGSGDALPRLI